MDSSKGAVGLTGHMRRMAATVSLAAAMMLSACGGAGGSDGAVSVLMPPQVTPKSCNNIGGNLDTLQAVLLQQLGPQVQALPAVGAPAAAITIVLAQQLDAVDAISGALTTLARTQDAQQFTTQLGGAGDSLLCSSSSLSNALGLLAASQTLPIPGISAVQTALAEVSQQIASGLVGTTPGGDLTLLTSKLANLASVLQQFTNGLALQNDQPYIKSVLALNAATFNSLSLILNDLGTLDGNKLTMDVTGLLNAVIAALPAAQAGQLGLPAAPLNAVATQVGSALQTVNAGLAVVSGPLLQAVRAVLGGVNATPLGSATALFSDLIDGGLATQANLINPGSVARVQQVTQLLNATGAPGLLQALLNSFGGILPPLPV